MMPRTDKRPVNISLWHFHFPLNALLSIAHRISGVFLIIALLVWLFSLNYLSIDPAHFSNHQAWLSSVSGQLFVSLFWLALWFHWLLGVRHLLIEFCLNASVRDVLRTANAATASFVIWLIGSIAIMTQVWL